MELDHGPQHVLCLRRESMRGQHQGDSGAGRCDPPKTVTPGGEDGHRPQYLSFEFGVSPRLLAGQNELDHIPSAAQVRQELLTIIAGTQFTIKSYPEKPAR